MYIYLQRGHHHTMLELTPIRSLLDLNNYPVCRLLAGGQTLHKSNFPQALMMSLQFANLCFLFNPAVMTTFAQRSRTA